MRPMPRTLSLAVCLFDNVASTDFQGPAELFGFISPRGYPKRDWAIEPAYLIDATYLSVTMDPVYTMSGPALVPSRTYESIEEDEQFDILLVPGGIGSRTTPQAVLDFLKSQAPRAKYILSVCTGAEVLGRAGILQGHKATTNKRAFTRISSSEDGKGVEWIPTARYVVDGKIWSSAGVTAGMDMAYAFLQKLVGPEVSDVIRTIVELPKRGDDVEEEFARYYKLI